MSRETPFEAVGTRASPFTGLWSKISSPIMWGILKIIRDNYFLAMSGGLYSRCRISKYRNFPKQYNVPDISTVQSLLWCGSPSHRYFCTTEIGYPVFPRSPIPLAEMLHSMRGDDWLEEIQIGSKLTEI